MNKTILTQILNEKTYPGTVCRLKSTFDNLDQAKCFMDNANIVPGLIGQMLVESINAQLEYNVYLMIDYQFNKQKFRDFIEEFDNVDIEPILHEVQ